MKTTAMNIGFDDTDSPKGMCTTYLAYKMVDLLHKERVEFLDFPRLIRFNPNIPWKTRGNGADVKRRIRPMHKRLRSRGVRRINAQWWFVERRAAECLPV